MDTNSPIRDDAEGSSDFDALLRRFDPDRAAAGQKYEIIRRKLISFFRWNSCFPAEDLADETFDRMARILKDREIHDPDGFAWGVAKKIRQESLKKSARLIRIADLPEEGDLLADSRDMEEGIHENIENELRSRCLQACIQKMRECDRKLFLEYYNDRQNPTEYRLRLSENSGLTIGALRVRINRLRDELEKCVRRCRRSSITGTQQRGMIVPDPQEHD